MTSSSRLVRHAIGAAVLAGGAALVTACGSSSPSAAPTVTVTTTVTAPARTPLVASPSPSGPQPCATSALQAKTSSAGGAAGSFYYTLDLTNVSSTDCTLYGYPGVSFVTAVGGSQVGPAATRSTSAATVVALAPGGTAHTQLRVVDAGVYPPSKCSMVAAHWLKIYPPNQFTALYLSFTANACAGGASAPQILSVQTMQPGA